MRLPSWISFALVASLSLFAHAADDAAADADSDVVVLTSKNFREFVDKQELSLVEFYAPWCGHCKALAPEYEVAATTLKKEKKAIPIAKIDCTAEADICGKEDVRGYPTLKVFRKGKPAEFKGQRNSNSIISYMKKQALPALSELTASKIDDFKKSDKVVVVGYFSDTVSKKYKLFKEIANNHRDDYVFGFTTEKVSDTKSPAIVLYKTFDEGKNVFDGKWKEEDIVSFIKESATPLMDDVGPENYQNYVNAGLPIGFLFVENDEQRQDVGRQVEKVAKKAKGKINFVYIDANKYGGHAKNLNLDSSWPAFAIQEPSTGMKYPFDQEAKITTSAIQKFVDAYLAGDIKPSLKSEPEPEENDEPVKVIVGTTYEKLVLDKKKDVFLEIYAPWCGHCKKLAPVWDELATMLKDDKNILIAKMDGTENDLPAAAGYQVEGFPTLKLIKAETNEVVSFGNGDRTLDALLDFLKKNATHGKKIKADIPTSEDDDEDEDEHDHDHDEL